MNLSAKSMNKVLTLMLGLWAAVPSQLQAQQVYVSRNATISFYSSAPIEDIQAQTSQAVSAVNLATGSVYFKVQIRSFRFPKSLMQEHFNTDYMGSDQYPYAEFSGKLQGLPADPADGAYPVMVDGKLTIHGVSKEYKENGTLTLNSGRLTIVSSFKVKLADHRIKIPSLLFQHIAEVVDVKVNATYLKSAPPQAGTR